MDTNALHKLGSILYWIYTLRSESLDMESYSKYCDKIYEALLDIAPEYKPRQINTDFMDIILETNRRLNNEY
jgi:hypothetical protein